MKKIILIPILLFSLSLFSQDTREEKIMTDNEEFFIKRLNDLEKKNEDLEKELNDARRVIEDGLKSVRLTLESLENRIDSKVLASEKGIIGFFSNANATARQEIEDIMNKKVSKNDLTSIKASLEKKIKTANSIINENTALLNSNSENVEDIKAALKDQDIEVQETSGQVKENNRYILLSFLLGFLLLITCIVIYKLASKNKTNISSTKGEIKDILKLDNDLKNILEKHTQLLEQNKGGNSEEETLKSVKMVADEITTMENNIYHMDPETRGLNRIVRAIKNLRNNYKVMGYDIPVLLGIEWKEGDKMEIIAELPDESIEKGKKIITRVVTPRIDFKGEMIQRPKVEIKYNI